MKTNNFTPKVSIVIPVYNGSNYLREAIDSALAQTYKNIEIIVINDGSTDNGATEEIAISYGRKIKYYKKDNGGVATALNLGIKKMTGEYFSWLSHDDLYYSHKIETQVSYLRGLDDKKVVLYSNYSILQGEVFTPVMHNHEMLKRKSKYSLLRGCVNGITLLIPKAIFDEMGEFDERLRCTQDYDYWLRIQKKYKFIHTTEVLSVTRLHTTQDSQVSPVVVSEGDSLWIRMIESVTEKERKQYESTDYNYYFEMVKFLKTTPYKGALEHCMVELSKLESSYELKESEHKVSVVIPFYNRINQTIASVNSALKQNYKNIEVILVNDASTVGINKILNIVKDNANIKLINLKKNAGPAAARNAGILAASGEYIAFLDSDDEFMRNKIDHQLSEMIKHNNTVSYTPYLKRSSDGDVVMRDQNLTGMVVPKIIHSCVIATPTVVIKKSFLTDNNIHFNEHVRVGEDVCFWLEVAKHVEILLVDLPLTIVNVDDSSHAYDDKKLAMGIRNILTYLLGDKYYSDPEYSYEVSMLANHFHIVNENIRTNIVSRLGDENLQLSQNFPNIRNITPKAERIANFKKHNPLYKATRAMYYDGPIRAVKIILKIP